MQNTFASGSMEQKHNARTIICYFGPRVQWNNWKDFGQQKKECVLAESTSGEYQCNRRCIHLSISFNPNKKRATALRKHALNLVRASGLATLVLLYIIITLLTMTILSLLLGWMAKEWPYLNIIVTKFLQSFN